MTRSYKKWLAIGFVAVELVLYWLILTTGGNTLRFSSYGAIVLCAAYCLLIRGDTWMRWALLCTVGADFCLVICDPIQQLWGMVFFLGAQTLYAIKLYKVKPSKAFIFIRVGLTAAALAMTVLVLRENTDALALISLCYYAQLILNMVQAFTQLKINKLRPIAFVLFILCDTVVGLQVAAGGYLPIVEGSVLYSIIFMNFNLSWLFYLPSQVLLALSTAEKN